MTGSNKHTNQIVCHTKVARKTEREQDIDGNIALGIAVRDFLLSVVNHTCTDGEKKYDTLCFCYDGSRM